MDGRGDVTRLLSAYCKGDRAALDRVMDIVYADLREIAHAHIVRRPNGNSLATTSLIHEAYLRLVDQTSATIEHRAHFYAVCARAMRQIVISRARRRLTAKRGGGIPHVPWADDARGAAAPSANGHAEWVLDLERALERLAARDERLARVVECRFYAGLSEEETATALGCSVRTVERDWKRARARLRADLDLGSAP